MPTINNESLLKMLAWSPTRLSMGELYPAIDLVALWGEVETSQTEWRTIWPVNDTYVFSSVAENMYVSSSSTLDIGRIIFVAGLDAQFENISGYGITNGQNQSIITSIPGAGAPLEFFRINYYLDLTPSITPSVAQGDMYIAALTTPVAGIPPIVDMRGMIAQGQSRGTAFVYTVPANHMFAIQFIIASQDGDKQVNLRFRSRKMTFANSTLLYLPDVVGNFASVTPGLNPLNADPSFFIAPETTDITAEARGTSPVSGISTVYASGAIVDYRYVKNFRIGAPSFPI